VINVSDPNDRNETFATTYGKDTGISTSGTYQVRYYINGRAYSHIIDPNTGEPTQSDIVSVTLIGPSAADCDALSTALCVMGTQSALTFIAQRLENYKVIIIAKDGEGLKLITNMAKSEYISSGMRP
jgi:thiamine biosynthesis lipoprotein